MKVGIKIFEEIVDALWASRKEIAAAKKKENIIEMYTTYGLRATHHRLYSIMWDKIPAKVTNKIRGRNTADIMYTAVCRDDVWGRKASLRRYLLRELFPLFGID